MVFKTSTADNPAHKIIKILFITQNGEMRQNTIKTWMETKCYLFGSSKIGLRADIGILTTTGEPFCDSIKLQEVVDLS